LLPHFRGLGFASEAAKKCRDYAFENDLSPSLISIISLTNKPSESVARKNGMEVEKKKFYKGNAVNIFRISAARWKEIQ
jgi:RimJ/RimL family protein N-acetyltransferase